VHLGLIAQEVREVIPEAVVQENPEDYLGLRYTELVPVLISAVQQQQQLIEKKDEKVRELIDQVDDMQRQIDQLTRAVERLQETESKPVTRNEIDNLGNMEDNMINLQQQINKLAKAIDQMQQLEESSSRTRH